YVVTVTDKYGCSAQDNVAIAVTTAPTFSLAATDVSCFGGDNGSVTVSPLSGSAPFTYQNNSNGFQASETFDGLIAGLYEVQVMDANGCESAPQTAIVSEADPMFAFAYQTYDAPVSGNCGGLSGAIELYFEGGVAPHSFLWSNGSTDQNPTNLPDGYYEVVITDANGCETYASSDIYDSQGSAPLEASGVAAILANGFNISCNGGNNGSVDLTITGGTAPYTYNWSNGATTEDVQNLAAGLHSVTVTDQNNCTAVAEFNLVAPAPITVNAGSDALTYYGYAAEQCATLHGWASGGNGAVSLLWSNNATTASTTVCPTSPTTYTLTATDAAGCQATDEVLVYATDVRCGNGKKNDKVLICVNTKNNPHTICVSANAVPAHLAKGDYLGNCVSNARFAQEAELTQAVIELNAYPNPFSSSSTINLNMSVTSDVQLQLYDVNGKLVQRLFAGLAEAGVNYQFDVEGEDLPAGLYMCRLVSGSQTANIKLVLTK
ncbi:MAG: T9SS type A sorting domain-containing protein, partial [Sphingobacteriales bacterium]